MADRCETLVLFGATGDLARRKLYPALASLARDGRAPRRIIGVASSDWTDDDLRDRVRESITAADAAGPDDTAMDALLASLSYVAGDYRDEATFARLRDEVGGDGPALLYLAIPPSLFETVVEGLAGVGLDTDGRLVVEKPFGRDLASSRRLDACVRRRFPEESLFRIDHYLGKEQVLDLLVFRFANTFLEPAWNRHHIDSVQITMAEDIGLEGRAGFYEEVGALRDVVQNHLLQVLTLVAMEPPVGADAGSLRDEKIKVLRAVSTPRLDQVVRGQFDGYADEDGVKPGSRTETYVALELDIDSWRWAGVPFYIRTGKHLAASVTEVVVEFERPPTVLFARADAPAPHPNHLVFRIKPGEQVSIEVQIKQPGDDLVSRPVDLTYTYDERREGTREDEYARLLDDALEGDQRLFARGDGIDEAWRILDPILADPPEPFPYAPGTWGPPEADDLIAGAGGWHEPEFDGAGGA